MSARPSLYEEFKLGSSAEPVVQAATERWAWCLKDAPADWPTKLYRYDRDFTPLLERSADRAPSTGPVVKSAPRPTADGPAKQRKAALMADWHRGYSARVTPIKASLGKVIGVFRGSGKADTQALCIQLRDDTASVLGTDEVLKAPDAQTARYLDAGYQGIYRVAMACLAGRDAIVRAELKKVEKDLGSAAQLLSRYGLKI